MEHIAFPSDFDQEFFRQMMWKNIPDAQAEKLQAVLEETKGVVVYNITKQQFGVAHGTPQKA